MKNYKKTIPSNYDFSKLGCTELTGDILFKINGGKEVENSHAAVASASVGDTVTGSDGKTRTISQGDINYSKEKISGSSGGSSSGSSSTDNTNASPAPTSSPSPTTSTQSKPSTTSSSSSSSSSSPSSSGGSKSSGGYTSGGSTNSANTSGSFQYNPNEPDTDKRFNAKDYNDEHLMTIRYDDKTNFDEFAGYYLTIGKYGTADTISYDGIGLTNDNGNIIHVLKSEDTVLQYAEYLNPSYKHKVNLEKVLNFLSSATGIANVALDNIANNIDDVTVLNNVTKVSKTASTISSITGLFSGYNDYSKLREKPTFNNLTNLLSDGIGLIPVVGPYAGATTSAIFYATGKCVNTGLDIMALKETGCFNGFRNPFTYNPIKNNGFLDGNWGKAVTFQAFKEFFAED